MKVASPVLRGRVFCKENLLLEHIHERELLKRWQEIAYMLPEIIKVNIGYDYLEMLLCYTLTKIEQSDKIELEKLLTSKLTQETGVKIMGSLAHHWEQIGEARGIQLGKAEGKAAVKEWQFCGVNC